MMKRLETVEAARVTYIKSFQESFYFRFGVLPEVRLNGTINEVVNMDMDLAFLESVINKFIPADLKNRFPSICSKTRKREICELRMVFCRMAKLVLNYPLATIGDYCGGRDHTTIMYNVNTAADLLDKDKKFQTLYHTIETAIKSEILGEKFDQLTEDEQAYA